MSFLRRLYLVLLTLLLIAGITLFLLFPKIVNGWSATLSDQSPLIPVVVTVILDLILLALLYIQVRPDPRDRVSGLMMQASGAITEVSVDSTRARILKAVGDVPEVVSADAEVKPVHGRADIELQVTVLGHDVELPAKQKEINRALNQVIHKQLGLRMAGQPRVHIRFQGDDGVVATPSAPIVSPSLVKSVEVAPASRTVIVEPEPPSPAPAVVADLPKADEPIDKEKAVELPVVTRNASVGLTREPELPKTVVKENDDLADLDLDKEIANPAADDIVSDELFKDDKPVVLVNDGSDEAHDNEPEVAVQDKHVEEHPMVTVDAGHDEESHVVLVQDEHGEDKPADTSDSEKEPDLNNNPI